VLSEPKANLIRGTLMKRIPHVVSTVGGAASFFVLFLAIGEVEAKFRQDSLPLGYWGGAVIAFVVTVALCLQGLQPRLGVPLHFRACACCAALRSGVQPGLPSRLCG
jgi:hypothetical protein